jgi:hypothetical protein
MAGKTKSMIWNTQINKGKVWIGTKKSLKTKKTQNIWNLFKDFISLHRQNVVRGREKRFPPLAFVARFFQAGPF